MQFARRGLISGPGQTRKEKAAMKASELKALQAPLKEQYRNERDSAVITLTASGALDESAIVCKVDTGRAMVEAGLRPAVRASKPAPATCCCRHWWPAPASP